MKKLFGIFTLAVLCFSACKKRNIQPEDNLSNAEICITVMHHADTVQNSEIYLQFGAMDFPGYDISLYDTLLTEPPNDGTYCISNIAFGKYWLMASAWDSDWGDDVRGGILLDVTPFNAAIDTVLVVNEY